ncbi:hypothetical protein TIFTF001_051889 [Ficus carica]|uniref:Uncharacterized protein n=1 Tax=Ficus carica TaxID=3494 RepID=A0AA88EL22_FICCA|nr:hypothetical protein TIFTF001_051889 [Ficus carica]
MNHLNLSEFSVAFIIDLSNGFPSPFVASTTIPRFFFAGGHWVAVFYTKVRVTIQATGCGCHPNLIIERSWRLRRLRDSSQVGVVRIIWYQSFGSSLRNVREFSLQFFEEPFELIGIFRGVHYRLIKQISTTVCGVYDNTMVLVCGWTLGRGLLYQGSCHDSSNGSRLPSKPDCRTIMETF